MQKVYLCDIDGTIADIGHRLHYIKGNNNDWNSFFEACDKDKRKDDIYEIIDRIQSSPYNPIIYITGRPERLREKTEAWLNMNDFWYDLLYMRKDGDYRFDVEVKKEIYDKYIKDSYEVIAVFDDRDAVVELWRSLGLTCLQVQKGDY